MATFTDNFDNETSISSSLGSEATGGLLQQEVNFGTYLNLDAAGSEYVEIADNDTLDFGSDPFTLSCWIRITDTSSSIRGLISKWDESDNGWFIQYRGSDNTIYFGWDGSTFITTTKFTLNDGKWHLIACVREDATTEKVYVDGHLIGTDTDPSKSTDTTHVFWIGRLKQGATNRYISADVAHVRLHNAGLSLSQVREMYEYGVASNVIGHWPLNDGSGTTAADSVGSNDGTLVNTPTWVTTDLDRFQPRSETTSTDLLDGTVETHTYEQVDAPGGTYALAQYSDDDTTYYHPNGDTVVNGSYSFDGVNDYLTVTDPDWSSVGTGNFTVLCKFRTTLNTTDDMWLIEKYNGSSPFDGLIVRVTASGLIRCSWGGSAAYKIEDTRTYVNDGEWHSLMYVRTSTTTAELWLDGVLIASATGLTSLSLDTSEDLYIGCQNASGNFWEGDIADVRMYTTDFGQTEFNDYIEGKDLGATNLLLWYKMNGNANDSGPNGWNLTVSGAVNSTNVYETPPAGEPLRSTQTVRWFDNSNDYINVPHDAALESTSFTVSGWVKYDDTPPSNSATIVGKFPSAFASGYAIRVSSTDKAEFVLKTTAAARTVQAADTLPRGRWHHIAGSWNETTKDAKLYINGVNVKTTNYAGETYASGTAALQIGGNSSVSNTFLGGLIANCAYYSDIRSDAEIEAEYLNGHPEVADANIVSFWPLGDDLNDAVGTNNGTNNGSITGYDFSRPEVDDPSNLSQSIDLTTLGTQLGNTDLYLKYIMGAHREIRSSTPSLTTYSITYTGGGRRIIICHH